MPPDEVAAFAPGRVNVVGEHTDYNDGLALPFAIAQGITVRARHEPDAAAIRVEALDLDERDEFALHDPQPCEGWRAFVRGAVAELDAAGHALRPAGLTISGTIPQGAGLSSSAALTVALCLALIELGEPGAAADLDRTGLARLCSRVENRWTGAHSGLLDQLASLYGAPDTALLIDFQTLDVQPVALSPSGSRFVLADSGERHVHAGSGYNDRRDECARAARLIGVESLRDAHPDQVAELPQPLRRRAEHVLEENERVREAVKAIAAQDMPALGALLDASHASLRDLYEVSTPAVEATVQRMLAAGALGARLIGGGFGGSVLGLLPSELPAPEGAIEVRPGAGARVLAG